MGEVCSESMFLMLIKMLRWDRLLNKIPIRRKMTNIRRSRIKDCLVKSSVRVGQKMGQEAEGSSMS